MIDFGAIPVLKEKIPVATQPLRDQIQALRSAREPDWRNYTSFFDDDPMAGVDWDDLKNYIELYAQRYIQSTGISSSIRNVHAWWNVYGTDNHHCWHSHAACLLSGTFYVYMDEDSSPIEFKVPYDALVRSWDKSFGDSDDRWRLNRTFKPEIGELLIWPSWLEHQVPQQHHMKQNRCTISFNITKR